MGNPQFSVTMKLILALMMLCGAVISASVKSQVKAHVKGEAAAAKKQFKSLMARANKYVGAIIKHVEKRINGGADQLIAKQILVQKATSEVNAWIKSFKDKALRGLPKFIKMAEGVALRKLKSVGAKLGKISKKVAKNMKKVEKIYKDAFKDQLALRMKEVKPAVPKIEKKARDFLAKGIKLAEALAKDAGDQKKMDLKKVHGAIAKKFSASVRAEGERLLTWWI